MVATVQSPIVNFPAPEARPSNAIMGEKWGLRHVCDAVRMVAPEDTAVLISGETGTGKELIARAIHEQSARSRAPYRHAEMRSLLGDTRLSACEQNAYCSGIKQEGHSYRNVSNGSQPGRARRGNVGVAGLQIDEVESCSNAAHLLQIRQEKGMAFCHRQPSFQ